LSHDEFSNAFESLGLSIPPDELSDMIHEMDTDGDGTIDLAEFQTMMLKTLRGLLAGDDSGQQDLREYEAKYFETLDRQRERVKARLIEQGASHKLHRTEPSLEQMAISRHQQSFPDATANRTAPHAAAPSSTYLAPIQSASFQAQKTKGKNGTSGPLASYRVSDTQRNMALLHAREHEQRNEDEGSVDTRNAHTRHDTRNAHTRDIRLSSQDLLGQPIAASRDTNAGILSQDFRASRAPQGSRGSRGSRGSSSPSPSDTPSYEAATPPPNTHTHTNYGGTQERPYEPSLSSGLGASEEQRLYQLVAEAQRRRNEQDIRVGTDAGTRAEAQSSQDALRIARLEAEMQRRHAHHTERTSLMQK